MKPDFLVIAVFVILVVIALVSTITGAFGVQRFVQGMKREMKDDRGHADIMASQVQHMIFSLMSAMMSPLMKMPAQHAANQSTVQSQAYSPEKSNMVDFVNANNTFYQNLYNPNQLDSSTPLLLAARKGEKKSKSRLTAVLTGALVFVTLCLITVICFK